MTHDIVPGLEGVPIAESAISRVDGQRSLLEYRGLSIETLAENSTFEETSYLLLTGRLPTRAELREFTVEGAKHRRLKYRIIDLLKCLPETGHPMEALQAAVAAIGMFYPERYNPTPAQRRISCLRLIEKMPVVVASFHRLRTGTDNVLPRTDLNIAGNFLYMLTGEEPDPQATRILDICLILHAEHTMNASTFAGRVVASTLAHPYCVVSSALGALSGPLHGGANEQVLQMLEKIGSVENVEAAVQRMIANKERFMGFGHRVYKTVDPRARILKGYAEQLTRKSGNKLFDIAVKLEEVAGRILTDRGICPNVDFYSGLVYSELGIPRDCFTSVFAMARVVGWLAHWLEQIENNRIFRPTQKYVGKIGETYVPIDQR